MILNSYDMNSMQIVECLVLFRVFLFFFFWNPYKQLIHNKLKIQIQLNQNYSVNK